MVIVKFNCNHQNLSLLFAELNSTIVKSTTGYCGNAIRCLQERKQRT